MKKHAVKHSKRLWLLGSLLLASCGGTGRMIHTPSITEDMVACRLNGNMHVIAAPKTFGKTNTCQLLHFQPQRDDAYAVMRVDATPSGYGWNPLGMIVDPSTRMQKSPELLVINNHHHTVDRFSITEHACRYQSSSPVFSAEHDGNSLTCSTDGTIYLTSFATRSSGKIPTIPTHPSLDVSDSIKMLRPGSTKWVTVATGIRGANGIAMGPDEQSLLVCSWKDRSIWKMMRDKKSGNLTIPTKAAVEKLPFHPDNLKQQYNGNYELCGHVGFARTMAHMIFKLPVAKSQWVTLQPQDAGFKLIEHPHILPRWGFCASTAQPLPNGVLFTQTGQTGSWLYEAEKNASP